MTIENYLYTGIFTNPNIKIAKKVEEPPPNTFAPISRREDFTFF